MLVAAIQPALVLVEDIPWGPWTGRRPVAQSGAAPAADPETLPVVLISPDANRGEPTDPGVTEPTASAVLEGLPPGASARLDPTPGLPLARACAAAGR